MLELMEYAFMRQAMLAALLIGIALPVAGVLVTLLDVPFLGITMSHAAFLGAVAGTVLGFSPLLGASLVCVVAAAVSGPLAFRTGGSANVALSIVFSALIGLAFVLIHYLPGPRSEALGLIWGSILTVAQRDLIVLAVLAIGVTGAVTIFYRWIMALFFDRDVARTCGVPAVGLYVVLMLVSGVIISAALPAVGGILIFGLLVNPPSAARQLTHRLDRLYLLSALFGVLSCWSGLWISVHLDLPAGPLIVLVACVIFAICCGYARMTGRGA